ncbi:hypothetical protein RSW49_23285 [Escherichia coli]|uniref:DUF7696 family protein n=1 Tax=Escherichia coli TaxID=562 RepID=UPI0028DD8EA9|nr:hypothetical protein [Escherichia coli]MDT9046439.1 hypothetical protein [Escherichia coli]MDT9105865.1 hypothetical protein [Escherichia coli]
MGTVTLIDGRQVDCASEEWRHETEARTVLNWPNKRQRQDYLWGALDQFGKPRGGVLQIRGEAECKRLEDTMMQLWEARKKAANDNKPA